MLDATGNGARPHADVVATIAAEVTRRLRPRSSRMVTPAGLDPDFAINVRAILNEATELVRDPEFSRLPAVAIDYSSSPEFDRTGRLRADQNLHPAESLMAAEVLFDVALPLLADDCMSDEAFEADAIGVARALHHAIWRRFPPGAVAYAESLRQRLSAAHQESRQRLSRDLHDRVAHTIAAGNQRVELAASEPELPDSVAGSLSDGAAILRAALVEVRDLAVELRARVGQSSIDDAIRSYVQNMPASQASVEVSGQPWRLRPWLAEELLAIVVEALRNAKEHGEALVRVIVEWSPNELEIKVCDQGPGFNRATVRPGAIGLAGMAERAEMIGARFVIDTAPGHGTTVRVGVRSEDAG